MSKRQVHVVLRWLSPEEHGRKAPPTGPTYSATIAMKDGSVNGEWSVRLENLFFTAPDRSEADLSFIVDEAPQGVLRLGSQFALFEGRWPVAEGRIVSETAAVPS